jgi:hypothetical protein
MTARGGRLRTAAWLARRRILLVIALLVPIDFFALFVALLRLHRQRRDGPGFQPLQRDRLAGLLAIAVGIVVDALQRRVDLGDQLARSARSG